MLFYIFNRFAYLLAFTLCSLPAYAKSEDFLALLRAAAYDHPLSRSAAREVEGAASEQKAARWQQFPTPGFQSLTPRDHDQDSKVNRFTLEQPLYAGGRIDAGIDSADASYTSSQAHYQQVAQDTAIRLVGTWYDWQRNLARQAVLQDSVAAHRRLKEQIERRVAEGVSPQADLTLAIARLAQAQADLAQAQSAARNAYAQLTQLAGSRLDLFVKQAHESGVGEFIPPQPPEQWHQLALERDPQLKKLAADTEAADADIRVKRGQMLPSLSLLYQNDFSGPNRGSRVFLQISAQPGAGLSSVAGVDAAIARRDAAEESRRSAERDLEQALDTDFADYASAREQTEVAKLLRQSTQEVAASYSRQFVAGRKSWLDVLNAVREAISARLSILDAQSQLGQSWWRLRLRALGLEPTHGTEL